MSKEGLAAARNKMAEAGVAQPAVEVFSKLYEQLASGATGMVPEDSITPVTELPRAADLPAEDAGASEVLDQLVVIKLNGGLGTSMGLDKAKTLLEVRDGQNFLDLIVRQVLAARDEHGARLPLLFMTSFRTDDDTRQHLEKYPELAVDGLPLTFLQNQEPKLRADDLTPVEWPDDPSLEWCPPGHGDLYPALEGSGVLRQLLDAGFKYACVSNGDNLGAAPDASLARWFANSGAPYAAEVCRRTVNDKKGGHLAIRNSDGRLILRETAQTPDEEMHFFTDEHRHPFFHMNNLWFDLEQLAAQLDERGSVLGLPLIRNEKNVDPRDSSSPKVIQIESAMGAAIEVFEGATAIVVGRERFLPVKTTNELLLVRSDVYELDERGHLVAQVEKAPEVTLDSEHYKKIDAFEQRFPAAPSLSEATRLRVDGDWTFGEGVRVVGDVHLEDAGEPRSVDEGAVLR